MTIIIIKYMFNTTRLVIIIFQVSYYIGILFYIYCEIAADLYNAYDLGVLTDECKANITAKAEAITTENVNECIADGKTKGLLLSTPNFID